MQVQLDYARAALYGVTPAALASALESLSNGQVVSQVVDGARRFDRLGGRVEHIHQKLVRRRALRILSRRSEPPR